MGKIQVITVYLLKITGKIPITSLWIIHNYLVITCALPLIMGKIPVMYL